jgi:hypothetical protein
VYMTPEMSVIAKTTNAGPAAAHRSVSQGRRPSRRRGRRRRAHARVPCMQRVSRLQNGALRRRTSCIGPAGTRPCAAPAPHPCARRISRAGRHRAGATRRQRHGEDARGGTLRAGLGALRGRLCTCRREIPHMHFSTIAAAIPAKRCAALRSARGRRAHRLDDGARDAHER